MPAPTLVCRYLDNDALTQFDFNADQQAQRRKAQRPILASPEPKPMASTGVVYTTPTFHKNQSTSDMYLNMADIAGQSCLPDAIPIGVFQAPNTS